MSKVIFFSLAVLLLVDSCCCWINDINYDMLEREMSGHMSNDIDGDNNMKSHYSQPTRRLNMVFPGTKWCGSGNIASDYNDLGPSKEADMCCREHDHCPPEKIIPGGEKKYGLKNEAFYSRLHCDCDLAFLECLRAANTKMSSTIGYTYFNVLQTKCFKKDYPTTKCMKKGGWFDAKCLVWDYDRSGRQIHQWFDVPDFK